MVNMCGVLALTQCLAPVHPQPRLHIGSCIWVVFMWQPGTNSSDHENSPELCSRSLFAALHPPTSESLFSGRTVFKDGNVTKPGHLIISFLRSTIFRRKSWEDPELLCEEITIISRLGFFKKAWGASGPALERFDVKIVPNIEDILSNIDINYVDIFIRLYILNTW